VSGCYERGNVMNKVSERTVLSLAMSIYFNALLVLSYHIQRTVVIYCIFVCLLTYSIYLNDA
jgi:hypothetical protein